MNYRHAFHAGGFADVISISCWCAFSLYLHDKRAAFRVIDSHAGAGVYDLTCEEARRGGKWLTGIARIMQARFSETVLALVNPISILSGPSIRGAICRPIPAAADRPGVAAAAGPAGGVRDRPKARKRLIDALRRDTPASWSISTAGWRCPPSCRRRWRGLVLIDPSFEQKDEFERLAEGFAQAFAKWPTGSYLLWYPVKSRRAAGALAQACRRRRWRAAGVPGKCLRLEFSVEPQLAGAS